MKRNNKRKNKKELKELKELKIDVKSTTLHQETFLLPSTFGDFLFILFVHNLVDWTVSVYDNELFCGEDLQIFGVKCLEEKKKKK